MDVTKEVSRYYGLGVDEGVLVVRVVPEGPAAEADIEEGDVIVSVDGVRIKNIRELQDAVKRKAVGSQIDILIKCCLLYTSPSPRD